LFSSLEDTGQIKKEREKLKNLKNWKKNESKGHFSESIRKIILDTGLLRTKKNWWEIYQVKTHTLHLTNLPYPPTKIPGSALLKTYLMLGLKMMVNSLTPTQKRHQLLGFFLTTTLNETAIDFADYEFTNN
jgi:hypothetical protein